MRLETRAKSLFLLVLFCVASLSMTSFAVRADADPNWTYALSPDGNGVIWTEPPVDPVEMPPPYISSKPEESDTETEDTGNLDLSGLFSGIGELLGAFTPDGNLSLIDDFLYSGENAKGEKVEKQFLTVQSKAGNYYYIVIDRAGETENVYFLNLVDEADLLALMDEPEKEPEPATCSCKDKCYAGHVDTSCPICAVNMAACVGKEPEPSPIPPPTPTPEPAVEPQSKDGGKASVIGAVIVILLIFALAGGAVYYVLKVRGAKANPQTAGETDLDDYDYGEIDEDDTDAFPDGDQNFSPYYPDQENSPDK